MSELLNSLNAPQPTEKPWSQEVAEASTEAPEPVAAPDAPPEPEPAPEAPQAQETAHETAEEPDRRVPLKALQEERAKRAEYERQLMAYQQQMAEMQAYIAQQQMMGHNGGPPMEQFQEPDPETDPIGALKYTKEQLRQMQEMTAAQIAEQQQMAAQQQYVAELSQVAYQSATQFKQQVPDYTDAYRYALNSRAQELVALGTPEQYIPQIIQQEEMRLVDSALRNGRNPAEAIYQFAKARGFSGKQASVAPNTDPALQQKRAAVAASASAGGSPASKGELSFTDLANLNGAAFDSAWNKLFAKNKNSLFRE